MPRYKKQLCLLCGYGAFIDFPNFKPNTVTSDCRPWDNRGLIIVCRRCGHVQKRIDNFWHKEAAKIYAGYSLYYLSDGMEQVVFDGDSPVASARSAQVLERLERQIGMPKEGRLLDAGCGRGALLRSFSKKYPSWNLAGYDRDDRYREDVARIPGVRNFYSGKLNKINRKFNIITLLHVLEHVLEPHHFLRELREKLTNEGLVVIQVPDCLQSAFDLAVMDHCSHFMTDRLVRLIRHSGFEIVAVSTDWFPGNITLVARTSEDAPLDKPVFAPAGVSKAVKTNIRWLEKLVERASEISATSDFGILGTAVAGTWLTGALSNSGHFFVDEDSMRVGKTHLGRNILHPRDVPKHTKIYLALPPKMAKAIHKRFKKTYPHLKPVLPPEK